MALRELGTKIKQAVDMVARATLVDQDTVDDMLKQICNGLIAADVQVKLVVQMRQRMRERIQREFAIPGSSKQKIIRRVVLDELVALVDPQPGQANPKFSPARGRTNVVMFVGLQGAGKTTTVAKLALQYKRRGWKVAMVCADTFRAGADHQLLQLARAIQVPAYADGTQFDPVVVAREGIDCFKREGREIILVDTSGRHKQEAQLFEEMEQLAAAVNPDTVMYVLDGTIGQAAYDQVLAFKQRIRIGSIIVTKLDGHARGGGALSAVAAANCPITHIGTGEHVDDLESFDPRGFIQKMLGMGNIPALMETMKNAVGADTSAEGKRDSALMANRLLQGGFTLRDLYEQMTTILKMGPLNKVIEMIPGMDKLFQPNEEEGDPARKVKKFMIIMDSMTDDELDDPEVWKKEKDVQSRVHRIARGAGCAVTDVNALLANYRAITRIAPPRRGGGLRQGQGLGPMANLIPPAMLQQMGGLSGLQNMMRSMGSPQSNWPKGG
ncbi:signal peptide binding domain containing protein [Acanthamoeba castellanii str. Neff]|uniref:signal-recognition-particle GTPase n=1 Tax=Acanthamoeba castellanii (strain ATCC 30010 / Neff) TaxID=1257118 RepID=L8GRG0_ACACF|nr:signal peptide binding domain containing protein [Acanthamoeba castellanii str. Neff]ELR15555.1 signal peptide binding domain containing protein [Acanthamoeba castellanii str. Neff]